jgi:GTPase Era involved in 16S rRNA processing
MMDIVKVPLSSKNYLTISIIGLQNSGKSTLLNHLFGTQFEVLTKQAGSKTTQGVWLSGDKQMPWIVMDVEGNDAMKNAAEGNQV